MVYLKLQTGDPYWQPPQKHELFIVKLRRLIMYHETWLSILRNPNYLYIDVYKTKQISLETRIQELNIYVIPTDYQWNHFTSDHDQPGAWSNLWIALSTKSASGKRFGKLNLGRKIGINHGWSLWFLNVSEFDHLRKLTQCGLMHST